MTQPADILRAAADKLRNAATAAIHDDRSTWRRGNTRGSKSPVVVDNTETPTVLIETWAKRLEDVNAYLELVGPALGLAIAGWLDREAEIWEQCETTKAEVNAKGFKLTWDINTHDQALAVARAILGEVTG